MGKRVVFLNTGHYSLDERVFYHQAKSLTKKNYEVRIISTKEHREEIIDNIQIKSYDDDTFSNKEKITKIVAALNEFVPDVVICDTPTAVIATSRHKKNKKTLIVYDITEWYPAKKNFRYERGSRKILKFIILVLFNIFAGWKTDSFIFGEHYKSVAFRLLFFWKPSVFLPYYPDLNYIKKYPLHKIDKELNLFYSGMINSDKGIDALINAVEIVGRNRPELNINLKIIGNFPSKADEMNFESRCASFTPNVRTTIREKLAFPEYCTVMGDTDIFFDLRTKDIENTFCVPIKLFYYLACGRPVIYSNLRSIRNIIDHFDFGHLCEPNDAQTIAAHIINYTLNPEIYLLHATNALRVSEEKFNWNCIETDFILFIDKQFN